MSEEPATSAGDVPTRTIAILGLGAFVSAANLRVCDPLLPQIAAELSVTIGMAAAAVTAFAVSYGLCQIVVGPLGDGRGKLAMIVLGCLWAGAATLLCAVMPSLGHLVVLRFLAGAGGAAIIPLAIAWLGDVVPYERRQPTLARFASGQILGVVCGQAAGGLIGEIIGWRGTFVAIGVVHILVGVLLALQMRRLKIAAAPGARANWRQAAAQTSQMLGQRWVRVVLIATLLEGLTLFGPFAYVGAELHLRFGIGTGLAGAMLAAFGAGALSYSLAAPALVARIGKPGLATGGSVMIAIGYAVLAVTPWLWAAPFAIACIGLGLYMFHNTLQTEATQLAPDARGLSISLFAFVLFTSQSLGVALAAPVVDRWGAAPVFVVAALAMPLTAVWFRRQLVRRLASGAG